VTFRAAPAGRGAEFFLKTALAGFLGVLAAVVVLHASAAADELAPWQQGSIHSVPLFTLPNASGADIPLADQRGHIVLVHFFATWCDHCREEFPALNRLSARAGGKVKVIAISVGEADLRVRHFLEKMPVDFTVLLDRHRATAKAWGVSMLPTTIVLDANLRPRLVAESEFAWDSVDPDKLNDMLSVNASEKAATTPQAKTKQKLEGG